MLAMMTLIDDDVQKALFKELYEKYRQRVFAISHSFLKSPALAEESTQETFFYIAKVISKLYDLKPPQRENYILITAKSFALDTKKKERKYLYSEEIDDTFLDDKSMSAFELADIRQAIDTLDEKDRDILYLHYSLGLDYKTAAGTLRLSPVAARKRAQYAKAKLKAILTGGAADE